MGSLLSFKKQFDPAFMRFGLPEDSLNARKGGVLVLIMLVIGLSTGCSRKQQPVLEAVEEPSPAEVLEALRIREPASGQRRDTVMLDFLLGMSRRQMTAHTMKLAREGKMYKVPKGANRSEYVYDLYLDNLGKVRTYFEARFYRDSLYKLECLPSLPKGVDAKTLCAETAVLYARKYGPASVVLPADSVYPGGAHYWIRGNREIELYADDRNRVVIHYVDLLRQRKAERDLDI